MEHPGDLLLVAGLGVAGIWLLLVPRYKATALIEVSPVIPQLLAGQSDMVPLYESYRGSQADYITNAVVLNGVLDDATVRQTRWYRGARLRYWSCCWTACGCVARTRRWIV